MNQDNNYRYVMDKLKELYPDREEFELKLMVYEFRSTHGNDSLNGIAGFLKFAETRGVDIDRVKSTISHDLNGRFDKTMLPRTDSYKDFVETIRTPDNRTNSALQ